MKIARPAEADHEVGDPERDDHEDGPDAPPRQRGALDEPGQHRAQHGAQQRDDDREADRVAHQLGGQAAEQQGLQRRPAGLEGLDDQEDQRGQDRQGDQAANAMSSGGPVR